MHPRNRYKNDKPDFAAYADTRESLKPFLIEKKRSSSDGHAFTLDFSNEDALRELTCACLEHDFRLRVEIPQGHLVPTVPQKLNYIHWLEDLLSIGDKGATGGQVNGIDIGTGASCIYPLLGATINGWSFLATEILPESVECAKKNVTRNSLEEKISIKLVSSDVVLMPTVLEKDCYDFCMCNPPFFMDEKDKRSEHSRTDHRPIPCTLNTGNESETITSGGEVEFVKRIISDSLILKDKIRWYSSMLGKKASLKLVKAELRRCKVPVVHSTQFVQGKTHRWAIAWSFISPSPSLSATPYSGVKHRPLIISNLPFTSTTDGLGKALVWLQAILSELKVESSTVQKSDASVSLQCRAATNTWSHQRRRRKLAARLSQLEEEPGVTPEESVDTDGPAEKNTASKTEIQSQLESLNVPCRLEFTCTLEENQSPQAKKRKMDEHSSETKHDEGEENTVLSLSFEWVAGDSKDSLHQIFQLIQNRLANVDC